MNKTVNINIGGLFFHIDEDAYQKLSDYFDAVKRSLSNSSGKDEIMKDIEMRVAELLTEKQKSEKHVVNIKDIDEVITVMGQPEDYRIGDEESHEYAGQFTNTRIKKLYRDEDKGMIGGVCSGLGHYFGIDAVWLRILFLILFFAGFGTGVIAYLILWIAVPKAVTTSEKLEMTGEPVNIASIEKKVKEEFDNVATKIKNADYDNIGNKMKSGTESVVNKIGNIIVHIFKVFAKILGAVIVFFSSIMLLIVCIVSVVLMFSSFLPKNTFVTQIQTPIGLETPIWIQGLLLFLTVGIPIFFALFLGIRLLVNKYKPLGNSTKYSLLALWIIALGIGTTLIIKEMNQIAFEGKTVQKESIMIPATDTLKVKFVYNDFYSKNIHERDDIRIIQDSLNNEMVYSNNISLHLMETEQANPYIQVEKKAKGKSFKEAGERAEKIKYKFKIIGNELILDNYMIFDMANKFRGQKVDVFLYLPDGIVYYPDNSVSDYLTGEDSDIGMYYGPEGYKYKVQGNKLNCLNCPGENGTEWHKKGKESKISIKIDGKITQEEDDKKEGRLTVDENGVIIKIKK